MEVRSGWSREGKNQKRASAKAETEDEIGKDAGKGSVKENNG